MATGNKQLAELLQILTKLDLDSIHVVKAKAQSRLQKQLQLLDRPAKSVAAESKPRANGAVTPTVIGRKADDSNKTRDVSLSQKTPGAVSICPNENITEPKIKSKQGSTGSGSKGLHPTNLSKAPVAQIESKGNDILYKETRDASLSKKAQRAVSICPTPAIIDPKTKPERAQAKLKGKDSCNKESQRAVSICPTLAIIDPKTKPELAQAKTKGKDSCNKEISGVASVRQGSTGSGGKETSQKPKQSAICQI